MRILIAHSFYRVPGGEDQYVRQQMDLLGGRHDVRLLARRNETLDETTATAARMAYSRSERRWVAAEVRHFGPDLVHLHNPYPAFGPTVHLVTNRRHLPLVATVHNFRLRCPNGLQYTQGEQCRRCEAGNYFNAVLHECFPTRSQSAAYATALWTHRFVMRTDDMVTLYITPSEFMRGRLREWGIEDERIEVVRNFTDAPPGNTLPGTYGLYIGRLSHEKGLGTLLRALREAGDPAFHFVGDGPAEHELRALAAELGLTNTHFIGRLARSEVLEQVAGARYVAFTSTWDENAPLAALEAMTSGRPLLVTRTGGLPELIDRGGGLAVDVGDVGQIGEAVQRLMAEDELCRELGERALATALSEFRPERHLERLEAAYSRAIDLTQVPRHPDPTRVAPSAPQPISANVDAAGGQHGASSHKVDLSGRGAHSILMAHCYYRDTGGENLSFEAETRLLATHGQRIVTYTRDNREIDRFGLVRSAALATRTVWADDSYVSVRRLVRANRSEVVHFQNTFPLISPAAYYAARREGAAVVQALRNYRPLCASGVLYRDGGVCEDCLTRTVRWPGLAHGCYRDSRLASGVVVTMQATHTILGSWQNEVDLYVAPSEFSRLKFIEGGFPADQIVTKPNFVDPDPGQASEPGTYAFFAGRLAAEKGVMTILEAWRQLRGVPLKIAGDGPLRPAAARFIDQHDLADRVELVGYQSQERVLELMKGARVAIFPSQWYETFGRVATEAFACGVPVVASRLGAIAEIVQDGITGLHFEPGDAADLAAKIDRLQSNPGERSEMGAQARAQYEAKYTAARNYTLLMEIYDRAIAHARSRQ